MNERLSQVLNLGRKVVLEVPEISLETDSGVLVEWNRQNAWLPKDKVEIERKEGSVIIKIPKWLFDKKW